MSQQKIDLIAFAPHPDDVELFCGGTVALLAARGNKTAIVDLTEGELASRGSVEERYAESRQASEMLGLTLRQNLKLPDGGINPQSETQLNAVVHVLRELKPELVLLPYWKGRHPDHVAASELIDRALFFAALTNYTPQGVSPERWQPSGVLYYQLRELFEPSFIVDISSVVQSKLKAIQCYQSQIGADAEAPKTLVSSELSVSSIQARDAFLGAKIGKPAAEGFVTKVAIELEDPLVHFKNHPVSKALFYNTDS